MINVGTNRARTYALLALVNKQNGRENEKENDAVTCAPIRFLPSYDDRLELAR